MLIFPRYVCVWVCAWCSVFHPPNFCLWIHDTLTKIKRLQRINDYFLNGCVPLSWESLYFRPSSYVFIFEWLMSVNMSVNILPLNLGERKHYFIKSIWVITHKLTLLFLWNSYVKLKSVIYVTGCHCNLTPCRGNILLQYRTYQLQKIILGQNMCKSTHFMLTAESFRSTCPLLKTR